MENLCIIKKNNFHWTLIVDNIEIPFMDIDKNKDVILYFKELYESMGYFVEIINKKQ